MLRNATLLMLTGVRWWAGYNYKCAIGGAHPRTATNPRIAMSVSRPLLRLARPRTIVCIGRNYADHIAELGNTRPAEPFYFLKPATSLLQPGAGAVLAPRNCNLHYEVELTAVIGRTVDELADAPASVAAAVKGWAVAIDMTARNCTPPPPLRSRPPRPC